MATTAGPAVARSNSRRQTSNYTAPASERLQRNPSTSVRSPPSQGDSHRKDHSQAMTSQQQSIAGVARRDHETTNLARSQTSHRSSSRDRTNTGPPSSHRGDSMRRSQRGEPRSGGQRYSSDMARTPSSAAHSSQTRSRADAPSQDSSTPVKRRTTITAQTGVWSLGKTIGAGSMGKVKIAKNMDTGEQVTFFGPCSCHVTEAVLGRHQNRAPSIHR